MIGEEEAVRVFERVRTIDAKGIVHHDETAESDEQKITRRRYRLALINGESPDTNDSGKTATHGQLLVPGKAVFQSNFLHAHTLTPNRRDSLLVKFKRSR